MPDIGIGIVGGGYMGKAHSAGFAAVGTVFETNLKPRLVSICGSTPASSARYAKAYGYRKAAANWQELVADPEVDAVVIATPQATHKEIALAAFEAGKPVLCEKPMGLDLAEAQEMVDAAKAAGVANMVGFNYIRTPASQFVRKLIEDGELGEITFFRAEMTEDFQSDPSGPASWRSQGDANGCLGDLAPHILNAARALMGPIALVNGTLKTVYPMRGADPVTNDDVMQCMCTFESGVEGHIFASRVATGRKMGYIYEITGSKAAVRFNQEDQNAVWLYRDEGPAAEKGFRKILTGPEHPDYLPFCQGPGHGTGYQDQIIIEAKDFLTAIETGEAVWLTFEEGLEVQRICAAIRASDKTRSWQSVSDF